VCSLLMLRCPPAVGFALNNCSEFQDVAITAAKAALLVVILDALRVSKNASWFEDVRRMRLLLAPASSA
jgi:hypothetical protein